MTDLHPEDHSGLYAEQPPQKTNWKYLFAVIFALKVSATAMIVLGFYCAKATLEALGLI